MRSTSLRGTHDGEGCDGENPLSLPAGHSLGSRHRPPGVALNSADAETRSGLHPRVLFPVSSIACSTHSSRYLLSSCYGSGRRSRGMWVMDSLTEDRCPTPDLLAFRTHSGPPIRCSYSQLRSTPAVERAAHLPQQPEPDPGRQARLRPRISSNSLSGSISTTRRR